MRDRRWETSVREEIKKMRTKITKGHGPPTKMLVLISVTAEQECEIHAVSEDVELLQREAVEIEKENGEFVEEIDPHDHTVTWIWLTADNTEYRIGEVGVLYG